MRVRREKRVAHASDPVPSFEALLVSHRGLDLGQSVACANLRKHVVQLAVRRLDVFPLRGLKVCLRDRRFELRRPDQGLARPRALGIANGLNLLRPRTVRLLIVLS